MVASVNTCLICDKKNIIYINELFHFLKNNNKNTNVL